MAAVLSLKWRRNAGPVDFFCSIVLIQHQGLFIVYVCVYGCELIGLKGRGQGKETDGLRRWGVEGGPQSLPLF